jgi:short-subunit dehydrogenase
VIVSPTRQQTEQAMTTKPVCVVVGAGPGIGRAVAMRFAVAGYAVALIARKKEALQAFVDGIVAAGHSAKAFAADAEHAPSLKDALVAIEHDLGPIDALVYNAAVVKPGGPLEVGVEQLVREFRVNVGGALVCAQHTAIGMRQRKKGTILLTGGGLALEPWAQMSSLAIGKAGIRSLAKTLHQELKKDGVRVATVTVNGLVKPGAGALDPAAIADVFWDLHQQPVDSGEVERIVS